MSYEYRIEYDREKKRSRKITGKLLGCITEDRGFIESSKRRLERLKGGGDGGCGDSIEVRSCKEYGVVRLIKERFKEYNERLEYVFGELYKEIIGIGYSRFLYRSPIKGIGYRVRSSFI